MLIVSYDFTDNRTRAKFSKFIHKFGRKIQYSVYEIRNSPRILQNIKTEIELVYKKKFRGADSIWIVQLCESDKKKVARYGYAENDEKEVVVFE